jgi:microcystin-dependent protein
MSLLTNYINSIPDNVQTGEIICTLDSTAPTGYLSCDGCIVSQSTYSGLYS